MIRKIIRGINCFNEFISSITMWLIVPLVFIMLYDVIMRYFFHSPTVWGLELSIMIFGVYMLFAGPVSILDKVQVGVDIFSARWPLRVQALVSCLTYAFTLVLFASLIWTSSVYAMESWDIQEISTSAWGQPLYHWKFCIPIAFFLTFLQTFSVFLSNVWTLLTGEEVE